jgi:adenosine kinase
MKSKTNILLSGSIGYDYIMSIPGRLSDHILPDHLDKLNLSLVADTLRKSRGGTAGNIAYTMSLLDTSPIVIGAVGSDGAEYLKFLRDKKVKTTYIGTDPKQLTPSVYIVSDKDGNQISTYFGGIDNLATPSIKKVREKIAYAIMSPSANTKRHLRECAELGIKTIFDPGQVSTLFTRTEFREMLTKSEYYIGNEYETEVMLKTTGWTMQEILNKVSLVIITKGAKGSELLTSDGKSVIVPICKPKVVRDPTGAGDAYRGGLLAGLARGYDIITCAEIGSVAGTYCVEQVGGQTHTYTLPEFKARYKKTYNKDLKI